MQFAAARLGYGEWDRPSLQVLALIRDDDGKSDPRTIIDCGTQRVNVIRSGNQSGDTAECTPLVPRLLASMELDADTAYANELAEPLHELLRKYKAQTSTRKIDWRKSRAALRQRQESSHGASARVDCCSTTARHMSQTI